MDPNTRHIVFLEDVVFADFIYEYSSYQTAMTRLAAWIRPNSKGGIEDTSL